MLHVYVYFSVSYYENDYRNRRRTKMIVWLHIYAFITCVLRFIKRNTFDFISLVGE